MKKFLISLTALALIAGLGFSTAYAGPTEDTQARCSDGRDNDKDGDVDCDDQDCIDGGFCGGCTPTGTPETICNGIDDDCDESIDEDWTSSPTNCGVGVCESTGSTTCVDGVEGDTCTPGLPTETPEQTCTDTLDNDCDGATDGADSDCGGGSHSSLTSADYPTACLGCHDGGSAGDQYTHAFNSVHYKWEGDAPDMVGGPAVQGKIFGAMNSYCINILGNWGVCGKCHAGRGVKPGSGDTKANVDCLMCHNEEYALARTRLGDGSMGPLTPTDTMYNNPAAPTKTNCLKCHAFGGGGDGVKRGDLANELITNTDPNYDVHMNNSGANKQCIDCHSLEGSHKISGRGSDLRPTDSTVPATCTNCHTGMDSGTGHEDAGANRTDADRHVARVSCQACHISTYGKSPTETHRIWRTHHDGQDAETCTDCPGHPDRVDESNLTPAYAFWNGKNDNYLLGEVATYNAATDTYRTSMPVGDVNADDAAVGGKLYPFKYKTSEAPISEENMIIAVDTWEYLKVSGNINTAVNQGVTNMANAGITIADPNAWTWGTSDTYQLITHGVEPAATVSCDQCHNNWDIATDNMLDSVGYKLKGAKEEVCGQCHDGGKKLPRNQDRMHNHIDKNPGLGCYYCHDFDRPERGLCSPCDSNPACQDVMDGPFSYPHQCN